MDAHDLSDAALAAQLAGEAGALLADLRAYGDRTGKALGDAGDKAANALICNALRMARPHDGLLSEEEKDNPARLEHARVWIVDPLDGTREYGEGRSDWAVHVALAVDGMAVVGAVALPGADGSPVLVVCNFTPVPRGPYRIGVPFGGYWRELLNSDATIYAGSGMGNFGGFDAEAVPMHGRAYSLSLTVPPLSVMFFKGRAAVALALPPEVTTV